jgi:hypothetical protein
LAKELRLPLTDRYDAHEDISVAAILVCGERAVSLLAKLDSGADYCFFERKYGEGLDLVIEQGQRIRVKTVNSGFDAYGDYLSVVVHGVECNSMVYFYAEESIKRNVLGRRGWLDRVRLGLVDHDCELYLAPYDE